MDRSSLLAMSMVDLFEYRHGRREESLRLILYTVPVTVVGAHCASAKLFAERSGEPPPATEALNAAKYNNRYDAIQ